ncbi:MAG: acetolactate synthase small subunit [Tepidanaerobacteraceae bacterium]|uniref:Acetolactate synthase small subunit n=1 Tax=Fervidicola ferrireducens TaxID=520764 RepID=A0A140L8W1_9FIRM|nr:acetolactate synthase small subunit [Fervidicola ferrireducens]KXG76986.1 putative acetolactate synthase small subunit [Fervidicola ferrireducens]MDN5332250.1 acetolactate synthase small subunit [Tepidanaerobacteraceae bacterium]
MKATLAVLVENHPGVLSRVAGLFARRGFNIESLAVGPTDNPEISRMTIVVDGDERVIEQIKKQLNKLVDVIKVSFIEPENSVSRELVMIKVNTEPEKRSEIIGIAEIFRANIIDVSRDSMIIELTGDKDKVNAMEEILRPFGIKELVRTGIIAMNRGSKCIESPEQ